MRLRIDGSEVPLDLSAGSTFGAVLAEAGRKVASQGRIVSRIVADGREISTRVEREMVDRSIGEVDTVDVTTMPPAALFREALDGAIDLSLAIRRDAETILSSLRAGDLAAAGPRYAACVESLGTFFQLAGAIFNAIGAGVFPVAARPGSAGELPTPPLATAGILQRLLRRQKASDWIAVADILEGEILPNIDGWSAFFKALKEVGAE
ncbi:hypothetical protein [Candidatus Deferrimicrobium sp.]|uniref:hypothetical protein n=1 Tax=Candidatus Deferrimicrobium sp. TaxID=3060586 RepID=UPI002ED946E6